MNTAELLVQCLQAEGVECIFGIPGEENADFIMAIEMHAEVRGIADAAWWVW